MLKPLTAAALAALLIQPVFANDETPAREAVGDTRDCIDLSRVAGRSGEGPQAIRFEMLGGQVYRNELPGRCPGLRGQADGFAALAFELHGGDRLCRGDRVRVVDSAGGSLGRGYRMAIPCQLGEFHLVEDRRAAQN